MTRSFIILSALLLFGGCDQAADPHALAGHWRLTEVWIGTDPPTAGHGAHRCGSAATGQALGGFSVDAGGAFHGWPVTDYEDDWSGQLIPDQHAWTFSIEHCQVDCEGMDQPPGRLGQARLERGQIEVALVGNALVDRDGVDCNVCRMCGEDESAFEVLRDVSLRFVYTQVHTPPPYTHQNAP
jgi:hypothetical protein